MAKRQRRGHGGVRWRRGRWEARISIENTEHSCGGFEREQDAWAWIATMKADAVRGVLKAHREPEPITFGNLARMLKVTMAKRWRDGTKRYFDAHCKSTLFPALEHRLVQDITTEQLQAFLDRQLGRAALKSDGTPMTRKVGASTVRKYEQLLQQIFGFGVRMGRLKRSPMEGVERARKECGVAPAKRVLSAPELRDFLAGLEGRDRAFFTVLAFTGLRRAELFRMTWEWCDFDGRMLRVRVAKRGANEMPMSPSVREELLRVGPGAPDHHVFPGWRLDHQAIGNSDPHKPLTDMRRPLRRGLLAAKIDGAGVGLHTFRHTFIALVERLPGVSYSVVRALARHARSGSDITTHYLHAPLEDQRAALAQLEQLVIGATNVIPMRAAG